MLMHYFNFMCILYGFLYLFGVCPLNVARQNYENKNHHHMPFFFVVRFVFCYKLTNHIITSVIQTNLLIDLLQFDLF